MTNVVVVPNKDLKVMYDLSSTKGTYRAIVKVQAGFLVTSDIQADSPIEAFRRFKPKALQSLGFVSAHGPIPVYARVGKKIFAVKQLLADMTVGDINQDLSNTALYSQAQYKAVNAKTWADKAFVKNS